MAGTRAGGRLAAATNKEKYGENFYRKIGAIGGMASTTGGFFGNPDLARRAGSLGGKVSRRRGGVRRLCIVSGCKEVRHGRGRCAMHYQRLMRRKKL